LAITGGGEGKNGWTEGCVYFLSILRSSACIFGAEASRGGKDLNLYKETKLPDAICAIVPAISYIYFFSWRILLVLRAVT
jgi:hypothetical protein